MNLPGDWVSHTTPSGYMDQYGCFKTIRNFTKLSGAGISNPQYLFFDGHHSHWDADSLDFMKYKHIHHFFLKAQWVYEALLL